MRQPTEWTKEQTELFEDMLRYKPRMMWKIFRAANGKIDMEIAENIFQESLFRAVKFFHTFHMDAKFSTWFYRILYNLCMTRVTRRKGKPEVRSLGADNEQRLDTLKVDEEDLTIHERLEQEELQEIIAHEIDRLPGNYKSAVTLFYVQEMSYEEISAVQDLPLGTVKTNLFRGRNLLRERVIMKLKGEMKVA